MLAPFLKINDIIFGKADDYTIQGYGHVNYQGFSVFVPYLLVGESGSFKLTKVNKTYAFGVIEQLTVKSPNRTEPFCPVFSLCGGCDLQHLNTNEQSQLKLQIVNTYLKKKELDFLVKKIMMMEDSQAYRNKVSVPFRHQRDNLEFGFYQKRSHRIVPFVACALQSDLANEMIFYLAKLIKEYQLKTIRHVIIRQAMANETYMVTLVVQAPAVSLKEISQKLVAEFPAVVSVIANYNDTTGNVILGKQAEILFGTAYLTDELTGLKFQISSQAFYQVNHQQAHKLYAVALDYANLQKHEIVLDLYSGIGTLTLLASQQAKLAYGIEVVKAAVNDAKANAKLNQISNAKFFLGEASQVQQFIKTPIDVIFVDPPRQGLGEATISEIIKLNPKRVVYISCNPKTLAEDLKSFVIQGYQIKELSLVDMFPETIHVECVVLMSRVDK